MGAIEGERHQIRETVMRLPLLFVLTVAATRAQALDMPPRKAGLWELKMSMEGLSMAMQTFQHCIDAATDKAMNDVGGGMRAEQCSKQDMQRSGNSITVNSVCNIGGATTTSRAVVTGDFNSGYTVKMNSKREGGPAIPGLPAETIITIEAKWTGPCKADQRPGDVVMANGTKMNVIDMRKGAPGAGKK